MLRGACAATIQTLGSGSVVSVVERIATFDSLTSTNIQELGSYSEGDSTSPVGARKSIVAENAVLT
jgi:hypothetical protein